MAAVYLGGIQVVATFVPIITCLYLFLSLLEDSGYLPRLFREGFNGRVLAAEATAEMLGFLFMERSVPGDDRSFLITHHFLLP